MLVCLVIAPALLFPTPSRLLVLVLLPVIWFGAQRNGGRFLPKTPLDAAIAVLIVMVGVSLFATFDVRFSLGKVAGVLLGVALYYSAVRNVNGRRELEWAVWAYLCAGGILAVVGLLGTNWIGKFPVLSIITGRLPHAIRGLPGAEEGFQPNAVAGVLILFVPLQVSLFAASMRSHFSSTTESPRFTRRVNLGLQVFLIALTGGTLLITQSRGAWTGMFAAGLAFLLWHGRRSRVLAGIGVLAFGIVILVTGPRRVMNLAISSSGPGMEGNVGGRMEVWSRAIYAIQDFPLTGMGMNAFRKVMPILYPTFLTDPNMDVAHAHNHLLQAALDLGIPGLVAYLSIWLIAFWLLILVYRGPADSWMRAVCEGMAAGLVAHFMFGISDAIPLGAKVGILFWFALALCVDLYRVWFRERSRPDVRH